MQLAAKSVPVSVCGSRIIAQKFHLALLIYANAVESNLPGSYAIYCRKFAVCITQVSYHKLWPTFLMLLSVDLFALGVIPVLF